MSELIHTSRIKIYQDKRPLRRAFVEPFAEPLRFGVHGGVKSLYGVEPDEELPTTLDHLIAALAG
ncbi:MAG: hypothetical protein ACREEM_42450 [Blastocatellia bacterium]